MKKIEQKPKNLFDGYPDEFKNFMTVRPTFLYLETAFRFYNLSTAKI